MNLISVPRTVSASNDYDTALHDICVDVYQLGENIIPIEKYASTVSGLANFEIRISSESKKFWFTVDFRYDASHET